MTQRLTLLPDLLGIISSIHEIIAVPDLAAGQFYQRYRYLAIVHRGTRRDDTEWQHGIIDINMELVTIPAFPIPLGFSWCHDCTRSAIRQGLPPGLAAPADPVALFSAAGAAPPWLVVLVCVEL